jgi:cell division transport system permease protein
MSGAFGRTLINDIKDKVDINVYFVLDAKESDILYVKDRIQKLPEVTKVDYVSREQALEAFKQKWSGNALIMQGLDEIGDNPFPASLNVKAKNPGQYGSIADFLEGENPVDDSGDPLIEKINYQQNKVIIDRLGRIIPAVEKGGFALALVLVVVSIIVVFNTIRLVVYTERDEIAVMKLVGASNIYVRGPLVVSGIMYGVLSGIITLVVIGALSYWGDSLILKLAGVQIASDFELMVNVFAKYFTDNFGQIFVIIMATGILLGGISSYLAARRYLKV